MVTLLFGPPYTNFNNIINYKMFRHDKLQKVLHNYTTIHMSPRL